MCDEPPREKIDEAAAGAADERLDDSHVHQVRAEELVQQGKEVRIERRAEVSVGDELPARGDGERPLVVIERVHLGRKEQRVVVPHLQEVNHPKEERDSRDDEEPDNRGLPIADSRFPIGGHHSSIYERKGRSSYKDTQGNERGQKAECKSENRRNGAGEPAPLSVSGDCPRMGTVPRVLPVDYELAGR